MSEADFRAQAQHYQAIPCDYYPPTQRKQKPILQTLQPVRLGPFLIDEGRWTDGGSVPRIARGMAHPLGYLFRAFLVHDTSLFDGLGWKQANARFNVAMKLIDAPSWQRWAILTAVKANGTWQHVRNWIGLEADYVGGKHTQAETRRVQAVSGRSGP